MIYLNKTQRKQLEGTYRLAEKEVQNLRQAVSESAKKLKKLEDQRNAEIAAFWQDLKIYDRDKFSPKLEYDKELYDTLNSRLIGHEEADRFARTWYYRYVSFLTNPKVILETYSSYNYRSTDFVIMKSPGAANGLFSVNDGVIIAEFPHLKNGSWGCFIEDKLTIMAFFYRKNKGNINDAISDFTAFVKELTEEQTLNDESKAESYKEALYLKYIS